MSTENIDGLIPTTELEAINAMLMVNGTSPIENLTDPVRADVEMALNLIRATSRGIQSRGWHFNSVRAVTLTRDAITFKIAVPTGTMRLRKTVTEAQRNFDFSHREGFLWNNVTNLNTFTGTDYASGIQVDLVSALDFTALPEAARQYIFITAGRRFQEQMSGNADLSTFTKADEQQALLNLVDAEGLLEDIDVGKTAKDQLRYNQAWDVLSQNEQEIGWHFNFRKQVAIAPSLVTLTLNQILLPANTLRAFKSNIPSQVCLNASHRNGLMYDVEKDVNTWDVTKLPDGVLKVDIVTLVARADVPPIFKKYIDIKLARQLQAKNKQPNTKGEITGYTERDEFMAKQNLTDDQALIEDYSLYNDSNVANTLFGRHGLYGQGSFDATITRP